MRNIPVINLFKANPENSLEASLTNINRADASFDDRINFIADISLQ